MRLDVKNMLPVPLGGVLYERGLKSLWVYGSFPLGPDFDSRCDYMFDKLIYPMTRGDLQFQLLSRSAYDIHIRLLEGTVLFGVRAHYRDRLGAGAFWLANGYYPPQSYDVPLIRGAMVSCDMDTSPRVSERWWQGMGDHVLVEPGHVHFSKSDMVAVHLQNLLTQTEECPDPAHAVFLTETHRLSGQEYERLNGLGCVASTRGVLTADTDVDVGQHVWRYRLGQATTVAASRGRGVGENLYSAQVTGRLFAGMLCGVHKSQPAVPTFEKEKKRS